MARRLYVGNLPYNTNEDQLRELFSPFGRIDDIHVVVDRESGRPRGFAFVTMSTDDEAAKAVEALHDKSFGGRPMVVNEARERGAPPPPRSDRYGSGPGGGDRYGGGAPSGDRGPRPAGAGSYRGGDRPQGSGDRPPMRPGSGYGSGPRPSGGGYGGGYGGSRPDGPSSGPPRPRPPRMPIAPDPGEMPVDEPRRRQRPMGVPRREDHERVDGGARARPDEDDYDGVSNWRQLLDEEADGEAEVVLEIPGTGEIPEVPEEEDWRRYVDDKQDEEPGQGGLGRIIKDNRGGRDNGENSRE